jgi:hypothetical protein
MALPGKAANQVEAARKAHEDAEAAAAVEGRRLGKAIEAADRFAVEAASIDPDVDAKGFERATSKLAEYRATVEILRTREAGAKAKAEAARSVLTAATNADRQAQLDAANTEIRGREARAFEAMRVALETFAAEVALISEAMSKARTLEGELKAAGVVGVGAVRGTTSGWAGTPPARLAQLVGEFMPR